MSSVILQAFRTTARRTAVAPRAAAGVAPRYESTSTMHENDPEVLGREKQKNLDGNQHKSGSTPHDNAPGWNELLASQSEAAIKADKADGLSPEMLSKKTVEHIKARHHAEDSTVGVEAEYEKDEVTGPLKKAYTKVKETVTSTSSSSS